MSNNIIFYIALALFIVSLSVMYMGFIMHINNKARKEEMFKQLEIISSEFLDILDIVMYDNSKNVQDFNSFNEFCDYIVLDAKNRICNLIKDTKLDIKTNSERINIEISNRVICEFVDKLINDNKYLEIFESIYYKALEDINSQDTTEVSEPARGGNVNSQNTSEVYEPLEKETNIAKNIEDYYEV